MNCRGFRRDASCAGLSLLLLVCPALARKHPVDTGQGQSVLQVTTHLVQVNVIVKDRHGELVGGLNRDDFTVYDDGRPQTISIFRVEESQPPQAAPEKLPAGVFSNLPEREAGAAPAVTVILLDGLNTKWSDQASARLQVIKFLQQLRPDDRVALYSLGTRLTVLHDFTTDASALVQALARYHGRIASELDASEPGNQDTASAQVNTGSGLSGDGATAPPAGFASGAGAEAAALQEWMTQAGSAEAEYYMNQRVAMTVDALVAIAGHLEGLPGRKNLVWVSGGFPLVRGLDQMLQPGGISNVRSYGAEISRAAEALNNVNLAIYPVDARGLMVDPGFSAARKTIPNRLPMTLTDNFATMNQLAERTGGRAFYNTNDIRGAIRRVVDDSRLTYVLGYYPEEGQWNGEYRKIKVEVDRSGLKLQYRRGYAAVPEQPAAAPAGVKSLDAAVFSPLDATGVGFAIRAIPETAKAGGPETVRLTYRIDPRDITLTPNGQRWTGSVTVVIVELGPRGEDLKGKTHTIGLHLTPDVRQKLLTNGLLLGEALPLLPGTERIRVVVRDDPTGTLGSVTIPLDRVAARQGG